METIAKHRDEVDTLSEDSPDTTTQLPDHSSLLQEKYQTIYDPEETVLGMGRIGLSSSVSPASVVLEVGYSGGTTKEHNGANGVAYAQDRQEYAPYIERAEAIVYGLMCGNAAELSQLNSEFQSALSVRMTQRIGELNAGKLSQSEFALEIKKMISVACIGLCKPTLRE